MADASDEYWEQQRRLAEQDPAAAARIDDHMDGLQRVIHQLRSSILDPAPPTTDEAQPRRERTLVEVLNAPAQRLVLHNGAVHGAVVNTVSGEVEILEIK